MQDFAASIKNIDSRSPRATSSRSGKTYQAGIGPHSETAVVALVSEELATVNPERYQSRVCLGVSYPGKHRQKCDLCFGVRPQWEWSVEVKLLRMMGDNGKPNDNMISHILSPYPVFRSALTDCSKLATASLAGRKAILIYGFDYQQFPMNDVIDSFELLAKARVRLSERYWAPFSDLVHPIHRAGQVFGWEILSSD